MMRLADSVVGILTRAEEGTAPTRAECLELLAYPTESPEAGATMALANVLSRKRFGNSASIAAQIGIDTMPCPGECGFCAFGAGHTRLAERHLSNEEIVAQTLAFVADDGLCDITLMATHAYDFPRFLEIIGLVRSHLPSHMHVSVNTGDFDRVQAEEIRAAGATGVYHVCRLREGIDTRLDPEVRKASMRAAREAGLDLGFLIEPIGPEHTPEEIVDQMQIGLDYECCGHGAMRRVGVPGTPLWGKGQITNRRLAQIVAMVALATTGVFSVRSICVHEPNLLGLTSGANEVCAESCANPRDLEADTALRRGLGACASRELLWEAGFTALRRGDGSVVPLTLQMMATASPIASTCV
jgi:biotin synthase